MKRIALFSAAVRALAAAPAAAQQPDWEAQVRNQLVEAGERLEGSGITLAQPIRTGALNQDATQGIAVTLDIGRERLGEPHPLRHLPPGGQHGGVQQRAVPLRGGDLRQVKASHRDTEGTARETERPSSVLAVPSVSLCDASSRPSAPRASA